MRSSFRRIGLPIRHLPPRVTHIPYRTFFGSGSNRLKQPQHDLTAIAGYQAIKTSFSDLIEYLNHPDYDAIDPVDHLKGVILSGPPGTGKSYIAEAIAGHAGKYCILISGPELTSKWIGDTEKAIREAFAEAQANAPSVLIFDEIDSVGAKRTPDGSTASADARNRCVNQMLAELSKHHPGVIVIGTTNFYESLDPALTRPGRFDRNIVITHPNFHDRKDIIKLRCQRLNIAPKLITNLAKLTVGYTAAELTQLVKEAATVATRVNSATLLNQHFDIARDIIQFGSYSAYKADNLEENNKIAKNEVGHLVIGLLLGKEPYRIAIRTTGITRARTEWLLQESSLGRTETKLDLENKMLMLMARRASDEIDGEPLITNKESVEEARKLALQIIESSVGAQASPMYYQQEVEQLLAQATQKAKAMLRANLLLRNQLVAYLVKYGELKQPDIAAIQAGLQPTPKIPTYSKICELPPSRFHVFQGTRAYSSVAAPARNKNEYRLENSIIPNLSTEPAPVITLDPELVRVEEPDIEVPLDIKEPILAMPESDIEPLVVHIEQTEEDGYPPSLLWRTFKTVSNLLSASVPFSKAELGQVLSLPEAQVLNVSLAKDGSYRVHLDVAISTQAEQLRQITATLNRLQVLHHFTQAPQRFELHIHASGKHNLHVQIDNNKITNRMAKPNPTTTSKPK